MEIEVDSQTTPPSTSGSSTASSSSSYTSSSYTSSSYGDIARIVPISMCSPESGQCSNEVRRAIERMRYIDRGARRRKGWKEVEERFDRISVTNGSLIPVINRPDFAYCIGMKETPEFAEELLGALRRRKEPHCQITKSELHDYWCRITDTSFRSRTQIFFDMCDRNMDGKITEMEIKQVISLSASTNKLCVTQEEAEEYAALIMEDLDKRNCGYIELSQLECLFKESSKSSFSMDTIPVISKESSDHLSNSKEMSLVELLFRTYWRRAWIIVFWLIVCSSLFAWKFLQYRNRKAFEVMGYCLCTAKGAAETLKFNMALILLPICRNTITWLRKNRSINYVIPFNDNINFHKLIAGGIVVGVILHGGTHLACDFPRIAGCSHSIFRTTIGAGFQNHQPSYFEILETTESATGIAMVVLMAIAFFLATPLARRHPSSMPWPFQKLAGFNTFWYSHHLFIVVYALLIVHSMFLFLTKDVTEKTTWMYIAIPVLLYATERVVRALRSGLYNVKIIKATTYPGKVLSLKLSKPEGFQYRSGMYVYIQCPQISSFEWHPFSLTSSPEDDHLGVHIRTLGDWTYRIYSLFQKVLVSESFDLPKICIDGPYGAASQDHIKYDIVMLIGLGIGATPFISIVRDILHGLHRTLLDHINDEESSITKGPSKAYLYWVTREQSSFEWFQDVMKEISETNKRKAAIEMHSFLTSVYQDGDARSALISAIQALQHERNGIDIISRTPVRTHFARPNWFKIFSVIARKHAGEKIGVFYCGPSVLAKELEKLCTKLTTKTSTRFVFHKENY